MANYADVFKRKEKKYLIDTPRRVTIEDAFDGRMAPDSYGLSRVTSLYFDTPDRHLIERSLDKPLYKEKLRVRAYGNAAGRILCSWDSPVCAGAHGYDLTPTFIELKKKYKGIVYKRRVCCSMTAAREYLAGMPYEDACKRFPLADPKEAERSLSARSLQISRELDFFVQRYADLQPSMVIAYDRLAFAPVAGAEDVPEDLLITMDSPIISRDLFAAGEPRDEYVIPLGDSLMEIKSTGPYPMWLVEALSKTESYPATFSKYGAAYLMLDPNENRPSPIPAIKPWSVSRPAC